MPDSSLDTTQLHRILARLCAGDLTARDELLRAAGPRLERLARKMLRGFPDVARWEQTEDIFQNAVVLLLRALTQIQPESVRDFFALAATQMRRELLDLARHYRGPEGMGAHHASGVDLTGAGDTPGPFLDLTNHAECQENL